MSAVEIAKLLYAQPFVPFRIHMSDGKVFEIPHPELVFLTRNKIMVGVNVGRDNIPETTDHCSLIHITRLEELPAPK